MTTTKKPKLNNLVFWPSAILCVLIVLIGVIFPETLARIVDACQNWVVSNFDWAYALGATLLIVFCLAVCFSKYGKIRIGGKEAKPEMSFWKWFSLVLTSGMGAGICFWCVAEPVTFFNSAPVFAGYESGTVEALENTLKYVFMHWTLHPYASYTAAGVCVAFMYWNCGKPFSLSSSLVPILGDEKANRARYYIDSICVFAIMAGFGTTVGQSINQLSASIAYITGINVDINILALIVCGVLALVGILAACTGLHKGLTYVSTANMWVFIIMMVFAFLFGGTHFILGNTVSSLGKFLDFIIPQALYTEPGYASGWVDGWTMFYWGWWIAFAPLIGLFQVKLSKGRTIRQYVLVNMLVPCLFLVAWMGIFGSSAMLMEYGGNHIISEAMDKWGAAVALLAYFRNLPLTPVLCVLAFAAMLFSCVTMTESEILTVSDMCVSHENDEAVSDKHAPKKLKIFWGVVMSLEGFALLYSGGLTAVQTISITLGFPILLLQLLMAVSALKGFRHYKEYDITLKPGEDYD